MVEEGCAAGGVPDGLRVPINRVRRWGRSLRKGTFVDRRHQPTQVQDFVLVPDGFPLASDADLDNILSALSLRRPEISFYFDKGHEIMLERDLPYGDLVPAGDPYPWDNFLRREIGSRLKARNGRRGLLSQGAIRPSGRIAPWLSKGRAGHVATQASGARAGSASGDGDGNGDGGGDDDDETKTAIEAGDVGGDEARRRALTEEELSAIRDMTEGELDAFTDAEYEEEAAVLGLHRSMNPHDKEKNRVASTTVMGWAPVDSSSFHSFVHKHAGAIEAYRKQRDKVNGRVAAVVESISEACAQTRSLFLLGRPFGGNTLTRIVCDKLKEQPTVVALGLFLRQEFSVISDDDTIGWGQHFRTNISSLGEPRHRGSREGEGDEDEEDTSPFRAAVPLDEPVQEAIWVCAKRTQWEHDFHDSGFALWVDGGHLFDCSRVLVFDNDDQRQRFVDLYNDGCPTGTIVAGGTRNAADRARNCISTNRPLFILEGTGGSANSLVDLMRFYEENYGPNAAALAVPEFEKYLRLQSSPSLLQFARNFPEQFREESVLVIDVTTERRISKTKLQAQIINVMASVYAHLPDMSQAASEYKAVSRAGKLHLLLGQAANEYKARANALLFLIRLVVLALVLLTLIQTEMEGAADAADAMEVAASTCNDILQCAAVENTTIGCQCDARGEVNAEQLLAAVDAAVAGAGEGIFAGGPLGPHDYLQIINLILPLLTTLLTSVYAMFRPLQKFGALFAASKRMESEIYKYKTRVGQYNTTRRTGDPNGHRKRFAKTIERIWNEAAGSDVRTELLTGARRAKHLPHLFTHKHLKSLRHADDLSDSGKSSVRPIPVAGAARTTRISKRPSVFFSESKVGKGGRPPSSTVISVHGQGSDRRHAVPSAEDKDISMDADEYIHNRLMAQLSSNQREAPLLARSLQAIQLFVILLHASSTAIVVFNHEQWVPALLATVSALEFFSHYNALENRIKNMNDATRTMTGLLIWWDGLSRIEQRMPGQKEKVVNFCESAVLIQHEAFVQDALASLKSITDDDNDDGDADEDGGGGDGDGEEG